VFTAFNVTLDEALAQYTVGEITYLSDVGGVQENQQFAVYSQGTFTNNDASAVDVRILIAAVSVPPNEQVVSTTVVAGSIVMVQPGTTVSLDAFGTLTVPVSGSYHLKAVLWRLDTSPYSSVDTERENLSVYPSY
jgi:hypothetical protein